MRASEYRGAPEKVTLVPHYVIELNIKQVLPGSEGKAHLDEVSRIVTKASSLDMALRKAKRLLEVEGEGFDPGELFS